MRLLYGGESVSNNPYASASGGFSNTNSKKSDTINSHSNSKSKIDLNPYARHTPGLDSKSSGQLSEDDEARGQDPEPDSADEDYFFKKLQAKYGLKLNANADKTKGKDSQAYGGVGEADGGVADGGVGEAGDLRFASARENALYSNYKTETSQNASSSSSSSSAFERAYRATDYADRLDPRSVHNAGGKVFQDSAGRENIYLQGGLRSGRVDSE